MAYWDISTSCCKGAAILYAVRQFCILPFFSHLHASFCVLTTILCINHR